jgi:hypothetical protein
MRKLVIVLIAFIAAVTFIRALDHTGNVSMNITPEISGMLTP